MKKIGESPPSKKKIHITAPADFAVGLKEVMNPTDMIKLDLQPLDLIAVESHYDGTTRKTENSYVVPYKISHQNLAAYFPEMNVLVPINHFADKSQTPISKSIVVTVRKPLVI